MASLLPPTSVKLLQSQFGSSPHAVLAVSSFEVQTTWELRRHELEGPHGGAFTKGQRTLVAKWWNPAAADMLDAEAYRPRVSIRAIMGITNRLLSVLNPDVRSALAVCLEDLLAGRNLRPFSLNAYGIQVQPCLFVETCREAASTSPHCRPKPASCAAGFLQRCFKPSVKEIDGYGCDEGVDVNKATKAISYREDLNSADPTATLLLTFPTITTLADRPVHYPLAAPAAMSPPASSPLSAFTKAATAPVVAAERAAMDIACLAGLPVCVTVFTVAGQIRHQNAASVQYYGNRPFVRVSGIGIGSVDKPLAAVHAPVAARPVDVVLTMNNSHVSMAGAGTIGTPHTACHGELAAAGGDPVQILQMESCPYSLTDASVLNQLFMFDRGKLEQMMSCVLEAGQVWEGIVRVPESLDPVRRSESGLKSRSLSLSIPKWTNAICSGEVLQSNIAKGSEAQTNIDTNVSVLTPPGSTPPHVLPSLVLPQKKKEKEKGGQPDAEVGLELYANHVLVEASDMSRSFVPLSEPIPESGEVPRSSSSSTTTTMAGAARTSS
ncbi:hypothetical protein Vafri_17333, partial [Volvox africanus]